MRGHGLKSLADLPAPRSVRDMAAIALALEAEAQRRLEAFAAEVEAFAGPEVLALLAHLAREHAERGDLLRSSWASDEGEGSAVELPESLKAQIFAEDDSASCHGYGVTSYKLLAFEVSTAMRRFALYSHAAAAAQTPAARDFAELCASQELALAASLRVERRREFRSDRKKPAAEVYPSPNLVESLGDLVAAALFIERKLVRHMTGTDLAHSVLSSCLEATQRQVDELQSLEHELGQPNAAMAQELTQASRSPSKIDPEDKTSTKALPELLAECERAFAFYDAAAGGTASLPVLLRAQALSQVALERIKRVVAARAS